MKIDVDALGYREKSQYYLDHPEDYPFLHKRGLRRLLGLWRDNPFENKISWVVLSGDGLYLRKTTWDKKDIDYSKEPVIYCEEIRLEKETCDRMFQRLSSIKITPFLWADGDGRDGDTYGISIYDVVSNVNISWWQEPPAAWEELSSFYKDTIKLFEENLPNNA